MKMFMKVQFTVQINAQVFLKLYLLNKVITKVQWRLWYLFVLREKLCLIDLLKLLIIKSPQNFFILKIHGIPHTETSLHGTVLLIFLTTKTSPDQFSAYSFAKIFLYFNILKWLPLVILIILLNIETILRS